MGHEEDRAGSSVVLHVTADPDFESTFVRELPEHLDGEVLSAASTEEALRTLRERDDVDCIVSDYDLPDVDGIAFLETVRVQQPDLPFVLFTSEGSEGIASRAIHARVTDYLIRDRVMGQWAHLASLIERAIDFHRTSTSLSDPETRAMVVLEAVLDAMAVLHGGSFVYANEPALDLFGAGDRDALGDVAPSDLFSPEIREVAAETFAALQAGEQQIDRLEQTIVGLDGLVTPVELTTAAIDWRGRPSILLICRDVSERRARARELERRNVRLGEIRRVISHQLRSPLAVARGRLELAREECESDHLDALQGAIDRIASILEETEALTRLDETVTEADAEPIRVTDLVTSCWQMVETADAILTVPDEMTIRGDPDRLSHLFENLFRNSVEHGFTRSRAAPDDTVDGSTGSRTQSDDVAEVPSASNQRPAGADDAVEHGREDATVRVGRLGDDGLYVEDDGPGIPTDRRERLMDPKRASGTGTETDGLGLLIVAWIAEAHGWRFAITEGENGGARIEFTGVEFAP